MTPDMSHAELVERAVRWLKKAQRCHVVFAGRQCRSGEIPDAIGWTSSCVSHLVECKVSRADFFADARKRHRQEGNLAAVGSFWWYLVPPGLVGPLEVPERWGLAEVTPRRVKVVRHALSYKRSELAVSIEMGLLMSEVRRYQLHGITYPPLRAQTAPGEPT